MLKPGVLLFLCVVVAGCGGSLRELKAQLRAKRARALGLQVEECEGGQCGYFYPEDQENPQYQQYQQVSLPQLLQRAQQSCSGQDGSCPEMEPEQSSPGQNPMYQQYPGQMSQQYPEQQQRNFPMNVMVSNIPGSSSATPNFPGPSSATPIFPGPSSATPNFPGQSPPTPQRPFSQNFPGLNHAIKAFPGQGPLAQNLPGLTSAGQNFPRLNPASQNAHGQDPTQFPGPPHQNHPGPPWPCTQEGLPPGANTPYCYTEDGQPRFPGISPQAEFAHRWRSPLPVHQDPQSPATDSTSYPGPRDQSYQQFPESPGAKLRRKLGALLHPPKQPSSKYSTHLSPNLHHPQAHHSPKFGDAIPAKMNVLPPPMGYSRYSDVRQPSLETEKPADLPSEWTQPNSRKKQCRYDRPSTKTTPKPLSTFFKDFLPKYVETVPPPTCPISAAFQEAEQMGSDDEQQQQCKPRQQTSPYDQQDSPYEQQPASLYEQPTDHQASQDHSQSHNFNSSNRPPYGHRSHFMPYQQK